MEAIETLISEYRSRRIIERGSALAHESVVEADNAQAEFDNLKAKVADLEAVIKILSIDPAFEILQRPALEHEMRTMAPSARYIVFCDVDKMHEANETMGGYEAVNKKIAKAVNLRSGDILLRGRWFSGDELAFVLSGNNPDGFCSRLMAAFRQEGLSIEVIYKQFSGDFQADVASLSKSMQIQKGKSNRGAE